MLEIMKKIIFSLLAATFAFAACQEADTYTPAEQNAVLSAQIEQNGLTKTSLDENNKVLWSDGDQIAAFVKRNAGIKYQIGSSFAGKSHADFTPASDQIPTGGIELGHVIAYYPYSSSVMCSKAGSNYMLQNITLPSEQTYASGSFGNGAFPMVAMSENNNLTFKNVCGGIKLQLKGSAKVASIKIAGRNNEKLSGSATITLTNTVGDDPSINMTSSTATSATLVCPSAVQLNTTTATEFIIALPPVEFTKGFIVTVTDTDSQTYTVYTDKTNTVLRSSLLVMPETTIVPDATVADNLTGWTDVTANYGTLPEYIKIYKSPSTLQGRSANAYIAVADVKLGASWDVWSVQAQCTSQNYVDYITYDSFVTPSAIYSSEYWQKPPVIINGGYWYTSGSNRYTSSLAARNSIAPLAYNINYEFDASNTKCYPTRAAFLEYIDGGFDACWTYVTYLWMHYTYPNPAPANNKTQPSLSYPAGAKDYAAKTGIGGGPVLIDNGTIRNTWEEEMLSGITPTTVRPRTAIGVTASKEIVFFVAEGDGVTSGVYGFTTGEVANILKSMGCVEAINLDGGGSTCMLVNGIQTIQPSDGSQRAIASAVMMK